MPVNSAHRILILIPVYNNPETIRNVVISTMKYQPDILVVDDGSDFEVEGLLSGIPVKVIRHSINKGKGAAILTGVSIASGLGYTHIITIDADGQHDPSDLPVMLAKVENYPDAIIVGRRDFSNQDIPKSSIFGRSFSNFWLRVQTGRSIGDSQSGFRAYPLAVLNELHLHEKHYSFEVEVLVKAIWSGITIVDVDVKVFYPPADKRVSHFKGFKDNLRISLLNTRLTMRSILPWPHRKIIFDKENEKTVSIWHPVNSIKALLTENTTPEKIAIAGALGVFMGALPLIACHMIIIILVSSFFRLNKVIALSTSQLGMPPFMPAICIETGYYFRNGCFLTELSVETLGYQAIDRVYEWFLGSLFIGPLVALIVGLIMFIMAIIIKKGRNEISTE
jgi:glycosyltransferase involved in cell wall biosynthesis